MRINAVIAEQAASMPGLSDILGKLNIGDVVKARVLEITSGELMLKLFDGTVFRAATSSEIDTAPGETLELSLKGRNDGTLIMETVKRDQLKPEKPQNEVFKLLDSFNLKTDTKNLEIAAAIKSAGLPATKELFEKAAGMLDKFKTLTAEKAVFLSTADITPEPKNINTLSRLIEGTLKLGSQLDELHDLLVKFDAGNADDAAVATKSVELPPKTRQAPPESPLLTVPENTASLTNKADKQQTAQTDPTVPGKKAPEVSLKNVAGQEGSAEIAPGAPKAQDKLQNPQADEAVFAKAAEKTTFKEIEDLLPVKAEILFDDDDLTKPLRNKDRAFDDIPDTAEALGKLKDSFKSLFIKTDSRELPSELDAKQLYKDLLGKLDHIRTLSHSLGTPAGEDIAGKISTIEDGIRLLNQINTNSTYIQIPLNISGFNTTGELYVLKNDKRKKRIDPGNVVMLIALDTQNIGRIETLVDIKDKNVGINLRAEDKTVMDFIKENFRYLYSSLKDKGYRLIDIKYRLLEEKTNLVNVEKTAKKTLDTGKVSFDLKI